MYNDAEPEVLWFDHYDRMPTPNALKRIQEYVDKSDVVAAHNLKYDMNVLRYFGISFENVKLHCTQVTEYLLNGQDRMVSLKLGEISKAHGMDDKLDLVAQEWARGVDTYDVHADLLEEYVIDDTRKVREHYLRQVKEVEAEGMIALVALQNEYTMSLSDIEMNGFVFDATLAKTIAEQNTAKLETIEAELREIIGVPRINIGASQQLSAALFGGVCKLSWKEWKVRTLKVRPESLYSEVTIKENIRLDGLGFVPLAKTETKAEGYYSTDKNHLEALKTNNKNDPGNNKMRKRVKELLLERSVIAKVLETMGDELSTTGLISKIQSDGKVHPNLNQTVTRTGRLSSSNPNSQNLPRGNTSPIKTCIVPEFDGIFQWDLSQIEWRGAAVLSNDPTMLLEINKDIDQHSAACVDIMEMVLNKINRTFAKIFNFRINIIVLTKLCEFRETLRATA